LKERLRGGESTRKGKTAKKGQDGKGRTDEKTKPNTVQRLYDARGEKIGGTNGKKKSSPRGQPSLKQSQYDKRGNWSRSCRKHPKLNERGVSWEKVCGGGKNGVKTGIEARMEFKQGKPGPAPGQGDVWSAAVWP